MRAEKEKEREKKDPQFQLLPIRLLWASSLYGRVVKGSPNGEEDEAKREQGRV